VPRKLKGIFRRRGKWRVFVRVNGTLHTTTFPLEKPVAEMKAWRETQITQHGGRRRGTTGSLQGDIERFLAKPEIAAQAYVGQTEAYLALWEAELGGDRARVDLTKDEIEAVLQQWLKVFAEPTVYHRRSALLSLYTTLDGPGAANPVKETTCPKSWVPQDQSVPYAKLAAIVAAMPDVRYVKKGITQPSVAKLVAAVIIAVGMRGADLLKVRRRDLDWAAGTVWWPASEKGRGVPAATVHLSPEGLAAFRAFDAAAAYGKFNPEAVSHSFKRAARRIDGPDTPIHLYSLRHSVGADLYRETRDLATVGRMLNQAPGSRATAQYARGANADVDRAAIAALSAARTRAAVPPPAKQLPEKLPAPRKARRVNKLRRRA
jgi:integrase